MRQPEFILNDIAMIDEDMSKLRSQRREFMQELLEVVTAKFETEKGIKKGDPIRSINDIQYFYRGCVERNDSIEIFCNPTKNNGESAKTVRYLPLYCFDFEM
jgi:hypothetical protein